MWYRINIFVALEREHICHFFLCNGKHWTNTLIQKHKQHDPNPLVSGTPESRSVSIHWPCLRFCYLALCHMGVVCVCVCVGLVWQTNPNLSDLKWLHEDLFGFCYNKNFFFLHFFSTQWQYFGVYIAVASNKKINELITWHPLFRLRKKHMAHRRTYTLKTRLHSKTEGILKNQILGSGCSVTRYKTRMFT